jgi:hypothetical protein
MSLEQLLANLTQSSLAHCLEQNYALDTFLQLTKQGLTQFFMPPSGAERRVSVLDVEAQPQSQQAERCALERWSSPQINYTVSTAGGATLRQSANRTKVIFRPLQRGQPLVDASQDYNRFDLINAVYALDAFRSASDDQSALCDFLVTCAQVLLPGGHLLCSVRALDPRICATIVRAAAHTGLVALTHHQSPLRECFHILDAGLPYKRLNLYNSTSHDLQERDTQLAMQYYFIVFTRQ